jgi:hypothetical protein
MIAGVVRIFLALILGLGLGLAAGCDSCGDDDDSGRPTGDDDIDDDSTPAGDDDDDNDNDDNDDTTPFCADGYLTPAGDCLTQIDGGSPGHNGVSAAVAPDGSFYVAAARGRDLVVYSHPPGDIATPWTEEIAVHMAADPVIAFDDDGNLHAAYLDIFNHEVRWGVKTAAGWSFEVVEAVGNVWDNTEGVYLAMAIDEESQPHLVYRDYANDALRYAQRVADGWVYSNPFGGLSCGVWNGIAIDAQGAVRLVTGGGEGAGLPVSYYATNAAGDWAIEALGTGTAMARMALDSDGVVHFAYSQLLFMMGPQRLRHRWGRAGDWKDELVLPDVFYMLYPYDVRVDGAGRPHLFYVATSLAETTSLEHAIKEAGGEWTRDVLASDPDAEVGYYDVKAYPLGVDDYSAAAASAPRGLVFYGPRPGYETATLDEAPYAVEVDYYYAADHDERFFYVVNDGIVRYSQLGDDAQSLDLAIANSPSNARMAEDEDGAPHLYYKEHAAGEAYAHWYLHRSGASWLAEAVPIDPSLVVYPQIVAAGESNPHIFFYQAQTLTHLWKEGDEWAQEDLESPVDTQFAVAAGAAGAIHVAFFRDDLHAIRYGTKSPDGPWQFLTAFEPSTGPPAFLTIATDAASGHAAICLVAADCKGIDFVEEHGDVWTATPVLAAHNSDSFLDCAVGVRNGTAIVTTTTGPYVLLQAARKDGEWTERVLDSSTVYPGRRWVWWDSVGDARLAYASEWAIQRAIIRAP